MAKYQRFLANVSDGSGTVGGLALACRSFTQAKKYLLDWLLTKTFDPVNGAPLIVAKPGVYASITHDIVEIDIEEEAKKAGYDIAKPGQEITPEKRFVAVSDAGVWKLEPKAMTPEEVAVSAEAEATQLQRKADAALERAAAAKKAAAKK